MQRRPPDPRYHQVMIDAHILDDMLDIKMGNCVQRIIGPMREEGVNVLLPYSVKREIEHPSTPEIIRRRAYDLIYTMDVPLTPAEMALHNRIRVIMRGNAVSDRHDSDAFHLVEASKYGGYFVTLDGRILKKREEIRTVLINFWPMRPDELVAIYEHWLAHDG